LFRIIELRKKRGANSAAFEAVGGIFGLKIQSGGQPLILQRDCIQKNILVWGINILFRVIELRKKKGSYSAVFEAVEGKPSYLTFNLETSRQSYKVIACRKIYTTRCPRFEKGVI
jgi:hypothetical protein